MKKLSYYWGRAAGLIAVRERNRILRKKEREKKLNEQKETLQMHIEKQREIEMEELHNFNYNLLKRCKNCKY